MKLLFVSDSFKGSLSSSETAALLTKAAKEVFDSCTCMSLPVADGGEGTVEAVTAATHGKIITAEVRDPLMRRIKARYGISGSNAIIEMAAASGLPLVTEQERNPLYTTTYGTGELIRDALRRGCRE
ncbi:MAG: glycerate kinase, partial [Ruminococcus sp.]|nr:glycerate kinase [Ruminococcus sp.]